MVPNGVIRIFGTGFANWPALTKNNNTMRKSLLFITMLTTSVAFAQEDVDMNINMGGMGIDMNVNVRTTTTTTTTTTGQFQQPVQPMQQQAPQHYVMPGYNGPIGCPWPIDQAQFAGIRQSVASKTWDESRITIAKQVIGSNCLLSSQVRDLMSVMEWEESRLDIAKFAYGFTYDIGNYYKLNDAYEWEQSIQDLNAHISRR